MISAVDIGNNLKDCFGQSVAQQTYYGEWCELGSFLSNTSEVLEAMQQLDGAMLDRICNKRLPLRPGSVTGRAMVTSAYQNYYRTYKADLPRPKFAALNTEVDKSLVGRLLSEVLSSFEKRHSFNFETGDFQTVGKVDLGQRAKASSPKKHVSTYHGFVEAPNFNKQLVKRSHWKDPGAEKTHGEFTHRIQWYAVGARLFTEAEKSAKVFESIGAYAERHERVGKPGEYLYLWDALCDRTNQLDVSFEDELFKTEGAPGRSEDFRSPENLNMYLKDHEGDGQRRWPLLRDFLSARYDKREFQVTQAKADAKLHLGDENGWRGAFQAQYLCRKLYNVSFWSLDDKDPKSQTILALMQPDSDQILKF